MEKNSGNEALAVVAHVLGLLTGFIGPLIMYLVHKEKDFNRDQIVEALNFQLTILIAIIISMLLMLVLIGFVLVFVIPIANFILCIVAAVESSKGIQYRYPFALRLIKP